MLMLVIDVGTTNTKGALVEATGHIRHVTSRQAGAHSVDGHVVQDPDEVLGAALDVMRELASRANGSDVTSVVIGGNQSALVWVDAAHRAVSPIDSWLDTRYYPHMRDIAAEVGGRDPGVDRKALGLDNFVHLAKVRWWLAERPDVVRRAARWTNPGCFVAGSISGRSGRDAYIDITSMAYSGLADLGAATWHEDSCEAVGIDPSLLPEALQATVQVGAITRDVAAETGLRAGTPVLAGCGDFPSAALGAGADFDARVAIDIGGTASLFAAAVPRMLSDERDVLRLSPSGRPDEWYLFAYVPGGRAIEWFDRLFDNGGGSREAIEASAARLGIGSEGLVFVPHLAGRMSPPDEGMRGSWDGIEWDHGPGHFYRSVLESVAFEYAGYLDRLRMMRAGGSDWAGLQLRVVGSAARNQLWNQVKADCLSAPVFVSDDVEAGLRGLAMIGAVGVGVWGDWREAASRMAMSFRCVAEPTVEGSDAARAAIRRYRAVVAAHETSRPPRAGAHDA